MNIYSSGQSTKAILRPLIVSFSLSKCFKVYHVVSIHNRIEVITKRMPHSRSSILAYASNYINLSDMKILHHSANNASMLKKTHTHT